MDRVTVVVASLVVFAIGTLELYDNRPSTFVRTMWNDRRFSGDQVISELTGDPHSWLPCVYTPTSVFTDAWAYPEMQIKARKVLAARGVALTDPAYTTTGFFHLHCDETTVYIKDKLNAYAVAVSPALAQRSERIVISWCSSNSNRANAHCSDMARMVQTTLMKETGSQKVWIACWSEKDTWKAWFSSSILVGTTGPFSLAVGAAMPQRYIMPVYSKNPTVRTEWQQVNITDINPPNPFSFYCA